jgi:hypothetical protein
LPLQPIEEETSPAAPLPLDDALARIAVIGKKRNILKPKGRFSGQDCIDYLYGALRPMLGLAVLLTLLTGIPVLLLPVLHTSEETWRVVLLSGWSWLVTTLGLLSYVGAFLDCTLEAAARGDLRQIRWPGSDLRLVLKSLVWFLYSFLAGPAILLGIAFLYWLYGGDLAVVDWLIIAELLLVAIGYWLLEMAAVLERGRLFDANPTRVFEVGQRLGYRAVLLAFAAGILGMTYGWLVLIALEQLHTNPSGGWLLLAFCWMSGLFLTTLLFCLLGACCGRPRRARRPAPSAED